MEAVIFGCGKIARGFLAQLLNLSGFHITFVEKDKNLVASLNESGKYYVNVMGNPEKSQWISNYSCLCLDDIESVAAAFARADILFTAVGGKNLEGLAAAIAQAYQLAAPMMGERKVTIIACENWKDPASQLREDILEKLRDETEKENFTAHVGVSEAVIMRSGVEATAKVREIDPNAVSVTDFWELPVDRDRMKGQLINFTGVNYKENFSGFLQQKIYTFNTTNATIAYLGRLRGIELLSDAANDPEIVAVVKEVQCEINAAVSAELQIPMEEQEQFARKALKKYQDRSVTDFTERHARDPIRKMRPDDRIVGTMRLAEKHNISYDATALTLAAAVYYPVTNPDDPSAEKLLKIRLEQGETAVLEEICQISPEEKMFSVVEDRIQFLKRKGWICE